MAYDPNNSIAAILAQFDVRLSAAEGGGTPTPGPTLTALLLSSTSFLTGGVTSVGITGNTSGSTIAATSSDGTSLSVSGSTLTGTFTAAGSPNITLTETLVGATNSGRQSVIGVSVATPTPTPTPASSLRSAATGPVLAEGSTGVTAGVTRVVHRSVIIPELGVGSTAPLRFALPYFHVTDSGPEVISTPQAGTTLSAQLEYQTGSTFAVCLNGFSAFDGKGYVWTDFVTPAQLGLASWPVDVRTLYLKWEWVFPSTGTNRIFTSDSSGGSTGSTGEGTAYGGNTTIGVYGGATGGGGTSQATRICRPWLVVADHSKVAIAGAGHSMMWGQADSGPGTFGQDITNGKSGGYWGRATVRGLIPTTRMGKPADRIAYWAAFTNTPNGDGTYTSTASDWSGSALRREAIGLYHQWVVFDQGFNDISNVDAQIVFAQLKATWAKLKADYPTLKIAQFEQSIRVSSASGNWDSAADQSPQSAYTDLSTSARTILNGLIRGAVGTLIERSINNVPLYNDPAKTDVWFSDGTAKKATIDGTHLRPYSQDLVATNLVNNHFPAMT